MQRLALASVLILVSLSGASPAQTTPAPPRGSVWDSIAEDLRNVRGLCYLPVYPTRNGAPDYFGVASATAMWHEYDSHPQAIPSMSGAAPQGTAGSVWEQLGWIKKLGINTIRVWLSYPMWAYHDANPTIDASGIATNGFVDKIRHFVTLCEDRGLYVMPVLWDDVAFIEPDQTDWIGSHNRSSWHSNPGDALLHQFVAQSSDLVGTDAERYVLDMVDAFAGSRAFFMWDVMNEPRRGLPLSIENFIQGTLGILETAAPSMRTNLAVLWASDIFPAAGRIARNPNLDSLGIHPYGHTRANIEAMLWDATHIADGSGGYVRKPILATEIGKPGWGLSYTDALRFAQGVPRPDLGRGETGMGCTPWGAMIGWEGGAFPFKENDGIFFSDGLVRERSVVRSFVLLARSQGVSRDSLFGPREVVEWDGSGNRVRQDLPTTHDDWEALVRQLSTPTAVYATFDFEEFSNTCRLFRMTTFFLNQGPLSSMGNPINDPSIVGNIVMPEDLNTSLWSALNLCPNDGPDPIDPLFRATMSLIVGAPFAPETDPSHLLMLTGQLLDGFRLSLLPYVATRGGPY